MSRDAQASEAAPPVDAGIEGSCARDASASAPVACTAGGPCSALSITGDNADPDAAANSDFHGYADPCIRADPTTSTLFMAYTFLSPAPGTDADGGAVSITAGANHLAQRAPDGGSWTEVGTTLWPSIPAMDPSGSGESGYLGSEVANLLPVAGDGGTVWYGAHLRYFARPVNGYSPRPTSYVLRVSVANSPADFASQDPSTELVLGTGNTDSVYHAFNLNALDPSLNDCLLWNEPALYYKSGLLYLAAECQTSNPADEQIAVFSMTPNGAPSTWVPSYVGALSNGAIAAELSTELGLSPPATELMQDELAVAEDGTLLVLLTPSHIGAGSGVASEVHEGCRALVVETIDPPTLAHDCSGKLVVRAAIVAPDEPDGTSSCGYDPKSPTGILLARRPDGQSAGGVPDGFSLVASGLRP